MEQRILKGGELEEFSNKVWMIVGFAGVVAILLFFWIVFS